MTADVSARYLVEHRLLPSALYSAGEGLLVEITEGAEGLLMDAYGYAEENVEDYTCPYTAEDFDTEVNVIDLNGDMGYVVRVDMPKPEVSPLCRAVYFCFDQRTDQCAYFTSELTPDGRYALCSWDAEGNHTNYGATDATLDDETEGVAMIFRGD